MERPCHEISVSSHAVEIWLDRRLPFEPKGDLLAVRLELRSAIRSLRCPPGELLAATYTSLDPATCDAENVLLYNVGSASFAQAALSGIQFERLHATPPHSPSGQTYPHHHHYRFVSIASIAPALPALSFDLPLDRVSTATKVHHVWWAASGAAAIAAAPLRGNYELDVLVPPQSRPANLTAVIKPLVDGIICGLHSEILVDSVAVERLAQVTGWSAGQIANRLLSPANPILGARRLLSSYREFVKWNPADDLCQRGSVIVRSDLRPHCTVAVRVPSALPVLVHSR